ncbi:hypothetical protein VTG60DRAFT_5826 [Thermothelomyces hinnuleus]
MLQGRYKVVLSFGALQPLLDRVYDLDGVIEVSNISFYAVLDAAVLPLQHILVVDGLVGPEALDLLVNQLILERLHLVQHALDAAGRELGPYMDAHLEVFLGGIDHHVDQDEGGHDIFHQQVLHADTTAAHLLARAHEAAHLSAAVNGDFDEAHPGVETPILSLLVLGDVHGLNHLQVALAFIPVTEEGQDFADELSRRDAGRDERRGQGDEDRLVSQRVVCAELVVHQGLQALDDIVLPVEVLVSALGRVQPRAHARLAVDLHEDVGQSHLALALNEPPHPADLLRPQVDLQTAKALAVERVLHDLAYIPFGAALLVGCLGEVDIAVLADPGGLPALLLPLPLGKAVLIDQGPFLLRRIGSHLALGLVGKVVPPAFLHERQKHLLDDVVVVRFRKVKSLARLVSGGELG